MVAALPVWLNENVAIGSLAVLVVLAIAIIRMVRKASTRIALLGIIVLVGVTIALNQDEIRRCGDTCECELYGIDVDVPACNPRFPGS